MNTSPMNTALIRRHFVLLLLLSAVSASIFAAQPSAQAIEKIDRYVQGVMDLGEIPGLSVSVYHKGKPLLEKGYGYANLEWNQKVTPDTVFEIASVSKTFAAMAIAKLVDAGKLSLDDTVSQHLPDMPDGIADITLRRMLNHTSGLGSFNAGPDFPQQWANLAMTTDESFPIILENSSSFLFEPGDSLTYSNSAVWFLSYIVEKVSGQSYGEFLEANIFGPFGMTRSRFNDYGRIIDKRASGYNSTENGERSNVIDHAPPAIPFGAGGLLSTTQDLQRYMFALHSRDQISSTVRRVMFGKEKLNDGRAVFYTTGMLIYGDFQGHQKYEHAGTIGGFTAQHAYYPDDELGIVVLSNTNATNNPVVLIENEMAKLALGIDVSPAEWEIPAGDFERYIGQYRMPNAYDYFGDFVIFEEDDVLLMKLGGVMFNKMAAMPPFPLRSLGGNRLIGDLFKAWTFILNFSDDGSEGMLSVNGLLYRIERL